MLVWHGESGEELEKMVSYGDNIGIGGTGEETGIEMLNKRIRGAQKIRQMDKDIWIHWFAFTNWVALKDLMKYDVVNSVDSTSWSTGSRFGITYVVEDNKISNIRIGQSKRDTELTRQKNRAKFRKSIEAEKDWIVSVGLDYEGMYSLKNFKDIEFWNIHVFEEYARMIWEHSRSSVVEGDVVSMIKKFEGNGVMKLGKKRKNMKLDKWFGKSL